MTLDTFHLHYHDRIFRLRCLSARGMEFQRFFEQIMVKHDRTFVPIVPHGREGDWKCDGWITGSGTVFQVYAPATPEASRTIAKIREDIRGAAEKWPSRIKKWIFVYAARDGLPPMVVDEIERLRIENPRLVIDTWSVESLWDIVKVLPVADRNSLLEPVPFGLPESSIPVHGASVKKQPAHPESGIGLVTVRDEDAKPLGAVFCFSQRQFVVTSSLVADRVAKGLQNKKVLTVLASRCRHPLEVEVADFDAASNLGWMRLSTGVGRLENLEWAVERMTEETEVYAVVPHPSNNGVGRIAFSYFPLTLTMPGTHNETTATLDPTMPHDIPVPDILPGTPLCDGQKRVVAVVIDESDKPRVWRVSLASMIRELFPSP